MIRWAFLFGLICAPALAQPSAETRLQDANIAGLGNTIHITSLPIHTPHGVIYKDLTIVLHADEAGNITFAAEGPRGVPKPIVQVPSIPPRVQQFQQGSFQGADGTLMQLVSGTSMFEGVPVWTFKALGGMAGDIGEASWYETPIQGNPHAPTIRRAGITSPLYSYGKTNEGEGIFRAGSLIGATETGDTLTIVSFRHGCCGNGATPTGTRTYTRVK